MSDAVATSAKRESFATRLYRGEVSWDFIGRRRWWYSFSGAVILVGVVSLAIVGLNPSIDFKGGAEFQGPIKGHSISQVKAVVAAAGVDAQVVETTGSGADKRFNIQTKTIPEATVLTLQSNLAKTVGVNENEISPTTIGSTWGGQITNKAIEGLIIFLVAVTVYLSVRFEWKMAAAAMIALIHDLIITAGIYSLTGLEVSPSTVIALLTILGYSLYDTVVVFDKVRENTAGIQGGSKMTFSQAANLAVNQTLVRSINTSVIALLPVLGLLVIGAGLLGAGSLDDLSVALFIGLASGAYSSIFIATPLLCDFKEREPTYQQLARRVAARHTREAGESGTPATTAGTRAPTSPAAPSRSAVSTAPVAADGDDLEPADGALDAPAVREPASQPARPAPRPGQAQRRRPSNRGGRPGGRGGKSRKKRR
jgi:preprotein translocase subunit SecF